MHNIRCEYEAEIFDLLGIEWYTTAHSIEFTMRVNRSVAVKYRHTTPNPIVDICVTSIFHRSVIAIIFILRGRRVIGSLEQSEWRFENRIRIRPTTQPPPAHRVDTNRHQRFKSQFPPSHPAAREL